MCGDKTIPVFNIGRVPAVTDIDEIRALDQLVSDQKLISMTEPYRSVQDDERHLARALVISNDYSGVVEKMGIDYASL